MSCPIIINKFKKKHLVTKTLSRLLRTMCQGTENRTLYVLACALKHVFGFLGAGSEKVLSSLNNYLQIATIPTDGFVGLFQSVTYSHKNSSKKIFLGLIEISRNKLTDYDWIYRQVLQAFFPLVTL